MIVGSLENAPAPRTRRPGFTLVELLVSIAIIVVLLTLLLPSLRAVRARSRTFACQLNLRSVAFDFQAFATPIVPMNRGRDANDPRLATDRFWLETFQESQYRVDEFWDRSGSAFIGQVKDLGVMGCPEVRGEIQLRSGQTCRGGAMSPPRHVSYALNLRLDRAERRLGERWGTEQVALSGDLLLQQLVPLIWDIDGEVARSRSITPHYSAPPGEPGAPYSGGREWFPALTRHGSLQVGFLGGEVLSSKTPLDESGWLWGFNP